MLHRLLPRSWRDVLHGRAAHRARVRSPDHTVADDAVGLITGVTLAGLGVHLLDHAGLITGQTAGAAFLIAYAAGLEFGLVYFAINLPFYWLAWSRMGATFTIRTVLAVGGLSLFAYFAPRFLPLGDVNPVVAAVVASIAIAMGLLALVRHRSSLGGGGILAFYLQDKYGFQAGWTQLIIDGLIFGVALLLLDPTQVAISFLGAAILNVFLALNHRSDRYVAR